MDCYITHSTFFNTKLFTSRTSNFICVHMSCSVKKEKTKDKALKQNGRFCVLWQRTDTSVWSSYSTPERTGAPNFEVL